MKKVLLTLFLVALGLLAFLSFRRGQSDHPQVPIVAGSGSSNVLAANISNGTRAVATAIPAATMATGTTAQISAKPVPRKRAWDYNYLASLTNTAAGAPIRFELVDGNFAT